MKAEPIAEDVKINFDDTQKQGKLILEANCTPNDIRFLTTLIKAREKLEDIIHTNQEAWWRLFTKDVAHWNPKDSNSDKRVY